MVEAALQAAFRGRIEGVTQDKKKALAQQMGGLANKEMDEVTARQEWRGADNRLKHRAERGNGGQ